MVARVTALRLVCLATPVQPAVRRGVVPTEGNGGGADDVPLPAWPCAPSVPIIAGTGWSAAIARRWCPDQRVTTIEALRGAGAGRWGGQALSDLPPAEVGRWLADPDFAPPDGESRGCVLDRVRTWLATRDGPGAACVVVAEPVIVRALVLAVLGGGASMEHALDVAPLSRTVLVRHRTWRVRQMGMPLTGGE
ncbi:histidine phosphatase family protein [Ameyamaea chiangmaiensis]|nr:histidine phosphatase family protein [Ameyamaea chiangmaiensis]